MAPQECQVENNFKWRWFHRPQNTEQLNCYGLLSQRYGRNIAERFKVFGDAVVFNVQLVVLL